MQVEMPSPDLSWMIGRRIAEVRIVEPTSWWFDLSGGGSLRADTLWRIVAGGRIQASSADHGHWFGLPKPVDSAGRAAQVLSNSSVKQASFGRDTGDVLLAFDNDSRLEVLTTSSGYEGWSILFPNHDEVIGLGGGQIELRKRDGEHTNGADAPGGPCNHVASARGSSAALSRMMPR
jgi:hypothetical protein